MRAVLIGLALIVVGACARPAPTTSDAATRPAEAAPQKPLVIAIAAEPRVLEPGLQSGVNNRDYSALTSGFLTYFTPDEKPMPYLADRVPSLDDGTWKVMPDGSMETTYHLNPNAHWHDGTRVTAADFVFTHQVRIDPAIPSSQTQVERRMGDIQALDEATLFISWRQPYIYAGTITSPNFAPIAQHVLEGAYNGDKDAFVNSPLLRDQFVGSGPYRVESWEPGAELRLRAYDGFVFGKAPIDQVVVKFIGDSNAIVANLLAGNVDVSMYSGLGFEQGQALEQAGWDGTEEYWGGIVRFMEFQLRDWGNLQPAIRDARVRQALLSAIDRSAIVDDLYHGKTSAVYYWMNPKDPMFPAVDANSAVLKFPYDPAHAEAQLAEAGWHKGSDGLQRNGAGDALDMPLMNQFGAMELQEGDVVLSNWRSIGITGEMTQLTAAQDRDGELRSKFPAVSFNRRGFAAPDMVWLSTNVSTPENRWSGQNRTAYLNPVLEENWLNALGTVDASQRQAYFVEALKAMTADAAIVPVFMQPRTVAYRRGLTGATQAWTGENAIIWNIWQWRFSSGI